MGGGGGGGGERLSPITLKLSQWIYMRHLVDGTFNSDFNEAIPITCFVSHRPWQ